MGNSSQWKRFVTTWKDARYPVASIHLNQMRLGAPKAPKRWEDLLAKLGPIPRQCGLIPVAGSIRKSDYYDRVSGTVLEVLMEGYVLAILALMDGVATHLSSGERVQVFFEKKTDQEALRKRAMIFWKNQHKTTSGWSILAGWESITKGTRTEASDFLCYALHQFYVDPNSQKSRLTASILDNSIVGHHNGMNQVNRWLDNIAAIRRRPIPKLTQETRRIVRE